VGLDADQRAATEPALARPLVAPPDAGRGGVRAHSNRVRIALASCLALAAAALAVTLTHAPPRVARSDGPEPKALLNVAHADFAACQPDEVLPAGTTAIRLPVVAFIGANVKVAVYQGARAITGGERGPDWTGSSVTVPVEPLAGTSSGVVVCFAVAPNSERVLIVGNPAPTAQTAVELVGDRPTLPRSTGEVVARLSGRLPLTYLTPGSGSWWSRLLTVARHVGLGRAFDGTWIAVLIAAVMLAVAVLATRLALRELPADGAPAGASAPANTPAAPGCGANAPANGPEPDGPQARAGRVGQGRPWRRVPSAAWMCAGIALLNACAWSLITPPFQGKDEVDHFAYVSQLAETGTLPANGHPEGKYSPEQTAVLEGIHYYQVRFEAATPAIGSVAQQRALLGDVDAHRSTRGIGEAGIATTEPPLYYALQTIPYALASGNMLNQLQLMRLVSALLGALTALLCFCFLREALPRVPWAASVGAGCIALEPLLGFMAGSVNPDTLLFTIAMAIFLCFARAFRRGLTRRTAVALGVLTVAGFATKLNFAGFAPGVFVGMVVLGVRAHRARERRGVVSAAIAVAIGLLPVALYIARNAIAGRPALGVFKAGVAAHDATPLFHQLSYMWELFLPRLPGMPHYLAGLATFKDIWFDRTVGLYGWMDTLFPEWVDNVALVFAGAIALLCCRELFACRGALRARWSECAVYGAIALGVIALVSDASYHSDILQHEYAFAEPRYLLPLLALPAAAIVLAVRGAGRRWAPVLGAALVVLFLSYDVFSQLQVIARYYG
jgi:hypothetical protein